MVPELKLECEKAGNAEECSKNLDSNNYGVLGITYRLNAKDGVFAVKTVIPVANQGGSKFYSVEESIKEMSTVLEGPPIQGKTPKGFDSFRWGNVHLSCESSVAATGNGYSWFATDCYSMPYIQIVNRHSAPNGFTVLDLKFGISTKSDVINIGYP